MATDSSSGTLPSSSRLTIDFEFLDRALEAQLLDVHLGIFGHIAFPDAPFAGAVLEDNFAGVLWRDFTRPLTR